MESFHSFLNRALLILGVDWLLHSRVPVELVHLVCFGLHLEHMGPVLFDWLGVVGSRSEEVSSLLWLVAKPYC